MSNEVELSDIDINFKDLPDRIKVPRLLKYIQSIDGKNKALQIENDSYYDEINYLRSLSNVQDLEQYKTKIKNQGDYIKSLEEKLAKFEIDGFPEMSTKAFTKKFIICANRIELHKQVEIELQNAAKIIKEYEERDINPLISTKKMKQMNHHRLMLEEKFLVSKGLIAEYKQFRTDNPFEDE